MTLRVGFSRCIPQPSASAPAPPPRRGNAARRRSGTPHRAWQAPVLVAFLLAATLGTTGIAAQQTENPFDLLWSRDLAEDISVALADGRAWTALTRAPDSSTLVAGSDNGGVVFIDIDAEGKQHSLRRSFQADGQGAVVDIQTNTNGSRAAVRYASGYMTILDVRAPAPLLDIHHELMGDNVVARGNLALRPDGAYAFSTGPNVSVWRYTEHPEPRYRWVGSSAQTLGPFLYVDPQFLIFGAVAIDGSLGIYQYDSRNVQFFRTTDLVTDPDVTITSFAVAADGGHVALGLSNGTFMRYAVELESTTPSLKLGFRDHLDGPVHGLFLTPDGTRVLAWSAGSAAGDSLLWAEGRNQGTLPAEAEATNEKTRRIDLSGLRYVATSKDLLRVLARNDDATVAYNMPSLEAAGSTAVGRGQEPALLDDQGAIAFLSSGTKLGAYEIDTAILPPPAARSIDAATGRSGQGPIQEGVGDGPLDIIQAGGWWLGIGILALVLVPLSAFGAIMALRARRNDGLTVAELEPWETEPVTGPDAAMHAAFAGTARRTAGTLVTEPGTEHPLVIQDLHMDGPGARLAGVDLVIERPGVIRVEADAPTCALFMALLRGHAFRSGKLVVAGADQRDTPILFARRVRAGLPPPPSGERSPVALLTDLATAHGLPESIVRRRVAADLAWLPEPLRDAPTHRLEPFDLWKLRIVLGLASRPDLLVIDATELPGAGQPDAARYAEPVAKVLRGVAARYEALVLLLDSGALAPYAPKRWCQGHVVLQDGVVTTADLPGTKTRTPPHAARRSERPHAPKREPRAAKPTARKRPRTGAPKRRTQRRRRSD